MTIDDTGGCILEAIRAALRGARPEQAPPPWFGWLAVALCRQRARQTWLVEVERRHLAGASRRGGCVEVPGLAGWSYYYHGRGLRLTTRGEQLDVDFHDGHERGATIDSFFFADRALGLEPM